MTPLVADDDVVAGVVVAWWRVAGRARNEGIVVVVAWDRLE